MVLQRTAKDRTGNAMRSDDWNGVLGSARAQFNVNIRQNVQHVVFAYQPPVAPDGKFLFVCQMHSVGIR